MGEPCVFCEELITKSISPHNQKFGIPQSGRLIEETENFYVISDLAPLMAGHVLFVSKIHAHGFSSIVTSSPIDSALGDVREFTSRFQALYSAYSVVEHGTTSMSPNVGCIAHAHLHLIPVGTRRFLRSVGVAPQLVGWHPWNTLRRFRTVDYNLVGDGEFFTILPHSDIPRKQMSRFLISRSAPTPSSSWFWQNSPRPDLVEFNLSLA